MKVENQFDLRCLPDVMTTDKILGDLPQTIPVHAASQSVARVYMDSMDSCCSAHKKYMHFLTQF